jgi:putative hydrolase of the HAD superfamily
LSDSNKIKAIIFDLGNVLIDFDHMTAARKISRFTNMSAQDIFNLFFDSPLTASFEESKISPREFFSQVKEKLNLKLDYDGFVPIWNEIFFLSEKNHAVYNLAKSLKKRYKLSLLSNVNILHLDYLKKNFPVFDAFHYVITSCELGCKKPDPAIYKKTLEILQVPPGDVFYTDDRLELAKKARELGINSFVFMGIEQLQTDLLSAGITIN